MTVTRVSGVLLDAGDTVYVVRALELLAKVLPAVNSTPSARLLALTSELRRKSQAASCDSLAPHRSYAPPTGEPCSDEPHALIGTTAAAAILGVSPSAVRQLAARGRLLASRRTGGLWLHSSTEIIARAEQLAAHQE